MVMEERQSDVVPREFLCCPLCREEYLDPKYLPCLHSFCKACIDDHIEATSDQDRCFPCPVCATVIDLTQEPSVELPDNTLVRRLSGPGTARDKREKTCGQCAHAGTSSQASTHCINCDEFFCEACAAKHLDQEETTSHRTQAIDKCEDEAGWPAGPQVPTLPRCCQFYDALDIGSVYCVDCELSLCQECHKRAHDDHRCAEVSAIATNFATKITQPLKELRRDKHSLRKAMTSLEMARNATFKNEQELKESVKKRTGMLCNLIRDYETILTMEIEKRYSQNLNLIKEKEEVIRRHLASIAVVTDLTEKLLTFGSDEEKVSMRRKIGGRVRELCEDRLPSKQVQLTRWILSEPAVTVETICEMFGELRSHAPVGEGKKKLHVASHSVDLGVMSRRNARHSVSSTEEYPAELEGLGEYEEGEDTDMLSESNTSDALRPASSLFSNSGNSHEEMRLSNTSSYSPRPDNAQQVPDNEALYSSGTHDEVPCHNLDDAIREMRFPDAIISECIKGVGVNHLGDIIVGTVSPGGSSKVFILEQHGIVRGQIPIDKNWGIHSVSADGKISLVMPRSESKYKVKVMSGDNNVDVLADAHIESFGLNFVTATKDGKLLAAASRYATTNAVLGRSGKHGGNITVYDKRGSVERVLTNETFSSLHAYLFDRPHYICADREGNFFVADPGRHSVIGFAPGGDFLFEYGNTDAEEELYQGPDIICTDRLGNILVFDKKDSRIDILSYEGRLLRCYFPNEHTRFISTTPDNHLMLVNSDGVIKYFKYN